MYASTWILSRDLDDKPRECNIYFVYNFVQQMLDYKSHKFVADRKPFQTVLFRSFLVLLQLSW